MTTAIYVAIVEGNREEGYSAYFPDLPGCVTAAETMLELPAAAREALSLHLAGMIEDGEALPEPTPIESIVADPEVKEAGRMPVDAEVEDAPVRVNISIGAQFLKRVDVAAEARGMTRSGFLIEAARKVLAEREPDLAVVGVGGTGNRLVDYLSFSGQRLHMIEAKGSHAYTCPSGGLIFVSGRYPIQPPRLRFSGPSESPFLASGILCPTASTRHG